MNVNERIIRDQNALHFADVLATAAEAEHARGCKSLPPCEPALTWNTGEWIDPPYDCPIAAALAGKEAQG